MTYREYLIYKAAVAAENLNGAIRVALSMNDEALAVTYLENHLLEARRQTLTEPNPHLVDPRPKEAV